MSTTNPITIELEALVGSQYDALKDEVLTLLENTHRRSSMVENFNSRLCPYLDEQKKFITQKLWQEKTSLARNNWLFSFSKKGRLSVLSQFFKEQIHCPNHNIIG